VVTATLPGKVEAAAVSTPVTADELLHLPANGHRYELVKGELIEMSPASPRHGRIAMRFGALIEQHVRQKNLGAIYAAETGFKLQENPDTVRAVDAAFIAQSRIPPEGEPEGFWAIAPDLVVEVVSPSDSAQAIQSKVTDWLTAGCRLVWVVYPDNQTVTEYRSLTEVRVLTTADNLTGRDVLSDFACPVQELFT
jgi:Uma2 family endonuclease